VLKARSVRWFIAEGCLALIPSGLFAQATGMTTGDIRGRVTDQSGGGVSDAVAEATSRDRGFFRSDATRADGTFIIRLLPPGLYRLSVSRTGFRTATVDEIRVVLGASTPVSIGLEIETVQESVTVAAENNLIDPASTQLSKTIDETKIRHLPINQRNFLDFALTTPGVTADRGPQTGAASTSGLSINGQSPRSNNILVDGLDNNDPAVGSVRSTFSQEAVAEYQVIQSSFAAEYGRTTGGIVNIITRSGSNDLHGSAFDFFRDDSLAADNLLTGTKTQFEQHQFGASLGGPLAREKLFFFGAAERLAVTDTNVVAISDDAIDAIQDAGFVNVEKGAVPFDRDRTAAIVKLDWSLRASHYLSLRGTYAEEEDENQHAWGGLVARSGGGVRRIEDSALAVTGISVLSTTASNEARILYANRRHRLNSLDPTGGVSVSIQGVATFGTDPILPQPRETTIWQFFDAVSCFRGSVSYKVGLDWVHADLSGRLPLYFAGRYQFSALPGLTPLEAFAVGVPVAFVQGFGDPAIADATNQVAGFVQGDWQLSGHLLLRAGIRYDYEDPISPFPTDADNWAPRLSFSWTGGATWRVRGGAGRFYGVVPIAPASLVAIENGERARTSVRTILGGPSPAEPWQLPDRRFGGELEAGRSIVPLTVYRAGRFASAYSDQASVGFEKELASRFLFHLDYLHVRGRNVLIERNINPFVTGDRPDPGYSDVFLYESSGNTWYGALTAGVRTGVGGPLALAFHYTYADAEDDHIDWARSQPQDPLDIDAERGPTIHVPRHKVVLSAVWAPGSRSGTWWKRDWTVAIIGDYASGLPYNELAGFDRNQNGDAFSDRPVGAGRNRRTLPVSINVDLRLARRFRFDRAAVEAIAEVFNLLDRKNVLEVNNVRYTTSQLEPNPDFGDPTRVADPRRVQLGARLTF
jgi:outer membrane receptor for ferrienterochelin and colicin